MKKQDIKKTALVLGGGGFIGGHLAKRLKDEGFWVRIVDIKEQHEYWNHKDICHDYICGDLRDPKLVSAVMFSPTVGKAACVPAATEAPNPTLLVTPAD
jgi:nucleoside-diphosphate-sugar epimerase